MQAIREEVQTPYKYGLVIEAPATLHKSYIFHDRAQTLGAPFVMFYNVKGSSEQIYTATSTDLKT